MMATTPTTDFATLSPGDFLVSSWGYDQTNIDFYKVISVSPSGKTAEIQKWESKQVSSAHETNSTHDGLVPGDHPESGWRWETPEGAALDSPVRVPAPILRKKISTYEDSRGETRAYVRLTSYSSASKWSGKTAYQTNSMYGH